MQEHLGIIIDQHFSDQAAKTSFTNRGGHIVTPDDVLKGIQELCTTWTFNLSNEAATGVTTGYLSYHIMVIYEALTGNRLDVQGQEHTIDSSVVTDRVFRFDDEIKILWGEKSSRAFL
jgi:hypothetical protein